MYQNFEGLERGEDIKNFKFFWVFPNALGVLNQKNLFPTLIYQFEHIGTPYCRWIEIWVGTETPPFEPILTIVVSKKSSLRKICTYYGHVQAAPSASTSNREGAIGI